MMNVCSGLVGIPNEQLDAESECHLPPPRLVCKMLVPLDEVKSSLLSFRPRAIAETTVHLFEHFMGYERRGQKRHYKYKPEL